MTTFKPFYGRFEKFAVLLLLVTLSVSSSVFAQQQTLASNTSQPSTPSGEATTVAAPDPSTYGKPIKEGKNVIGYLSLDGKVALKVGDVITLNRATKMDGRLYSVRYTLVNFHNSLNPNTDCLVAGDFAGQKLTITGVSYTGKTMFGPKFGYAFFKLPGTINYGEISIEAALSQNEFQIVK
ncbi:MAG: hypothetical protein JWL92_159 [Candidatus Nomurabacteria bacterium]|nr:hypothetical protein [Candidatus Nomurabacteria bacterium]